MRTITGEAHRFAEVPGAVCLHGDTPGAPVAAACMIPALHEAGVETRGIGGTS